MIKSFFKEHAFAIITIILLIICAAGLYFTIQNNGKIQAQLTATIQSNDELKQQNLELMRKTSEMEQKLLDVTTKKVDEPVASNTTTSVEYVSKESPNDADVQVVNSAPKVIVQAGDGLTYDMTPKSTSKQEIVDGKVVVTNHQQLDIDVDKMVQDRYKDRLNDINKQQQAELQAKQDEINKLERVNKRVEKQRAGYAIGALLIGLAF